MIKGLHIDICRHFIEFDTIVSTIELMAKLNFNTLHLHLSDDQSMPFESERYPQIKFDKMLTIENQKNIAQLCQKYNIDVIPEIDIPGHSQAFRHIFYGEPLEKSLGVITKKYINLKYDLPIIWFLLEELVNRFNSRYVHIGCDEAKSFGEFPELINLTSIWCKNHFLKFIVWDDVVSKIETIPDNMVVQRWRHYTSNKILSQAIPYILSEGYYLDHCEDPIYLYNKNDNPYGKNLIGHIACTWTELIDNNNFYNTIVPSVYLLSKKWSNPGKNDNNNLPEILYTMCQQYGYPISQYNNTWKRRRWVNFFDKDEPRSIANISIEIVLDREHDLYPVFSKFLVDLFYELYLLQIKKDFNFVPNFQNELSKIINENFASEYDIDWLYNREIKTTELKNHINKLISMMKEKENPYYNNGLIPILKYIYWNTK
jgi:hypothetical protein